MSDMNFEVVSVTPEMAKKWLASMDPLQRSRRDHVVDQYARDMISGAWKLTHQPIAFNLKGELIDGQHRLYGVVESGQTITMVVAREVTGDYELPIDVGFRRTAKDLLRLPHPIITASVILRRLQLGNVFSVRRQTMTSIDEVRDTYLKYESDISAACEAISRGLVTASAAGAIAFARPLNPEKMDRFAQSLKDGASLETGSPALQLRNWFARSNNKSQVAAAMVTLNAANAELRGVSIAAMYTTHGGYDHICQRRRALRLLDTPPANKIPTVLGDTQKKVLAILNEQGETSYATLCAETGATTAGVSDALFKLKKKGLVYSPSAKHWAPLLSEQKQENDFQETQDT